MSSELKRRESTIRDFLYVIFKYKWVILTVFLVVMIVVGATMVTSSDVFTSTAKLVLTREKESTVGMLTGIYNPAQINTEIELLKSRGFAEEAIKKVGPERILYRPDPANWLPEQLLAFTRSRGAGNPNIQAGSLAIPDHIIQQALGVFMTCMEVSHEPNTNVINLSYQSFSPELAQSILEDIISVYMEKHIEMHTTPVSLDFLEKETQRLKEELLHNENLLFTFRQQSNVVSLPQQQSSLLSRIGTISQSINDARVQLSALKASLDAKQGRMEFRSSIREDEIRYDSMGSSLAELNRQLADAKTELRELEDVEKTYQNLQRNVDLLADKYKRYFSSLEQARIAQTLEREKISNVSLMQKPTFIPNRTNDPKKKMLLALAVAILGGTGTAFLLEYLNRKVRTADEVEKQMLMPVITTLPAVRIGQVRRRIRQENRKRKDNPAPFPGKSAGNVVAWMFFVRGIQEYFDEMKSLIGQAVRESGKQPYILAVTSCYRKEGVSSVAAGLAYSLAFSDNASVLYLDANGNRYAAREIPNVYRRNGLDQVSIARKMLDANDDNTRLLLHQAVEDFHTTIDPSKAFAGLLRSVQKINYTLVVVDLPALSEGASAAISAGRADGTILVVESERVNREALRALGARLKKLRVNLLGVVLNRQRFYIPRWVYRFL